ncbi:MAG: hypothetical protein GY765_38870, partial [bacterium]|nr:hypothetical protein [bacterium]
MQKPLILILDEFDAMIEEGIAAVVSAFRNIYIKRTDEVDVPTEKKSYLLHGVALIGVRSVLGVENAAGLPPHVMGSPFNVQRSLKIPNLTYEEVTEMFKWYEKDSGQKVEDEVIRLLFYETCGQPGLVGWFGELLTETYNKGKSKPISKQDFEIAYSAALNVMHNINIRNLGKRYQTYLAENRDWLLEDVPGRKDLRIYEAVFHFNFYSYLSEFLQPGDGRIVPEFPTGNGKIDLLITYAGKRYGIELKS